MPEQDPDQGEQDQDQVLEDPEEPPQPEEDSVPSLEGEGDNSMASEQELEELEQKVTSMSISPDSSLNLPSPVPCIQSPHSPLSQPESTLPDQPTTTHADSAEQRVDTHSPIWEDFMGATTTQDLEQQHHRALEAGLPMGTRQGGNAPPTLYQQWQQRFNTLNVVEALLEQIIKQVVDK